MVAEEPIILPTPGCRRKLGMKHVIHIRAAEYWLALGNLQEASREVEKIQWSRRKHPDVQRLQEKIEAQTRYVKAFIRDDCILEPFWDFDT